MLRKGCQVALQAERTGENGGRELRKLIWGLITHSSAGCSITIDAGLPQACGAAQSAFTRHFGAPASHDSPTTPLSPIMPGVVSLPRKVISTALSLTGKAALGAATSDYVKNAVSSFAEKVCEHDRLSRNEYSPLSPRRSCRLNLGNRE